MRCNRTKLAKILGWDVKTIDRMVRDGMPYVSRPRDGERSWVFDTAAVLKWMVRDELADKIKKSRSRLAEAKAGLKWLEYGTRLGELVEKSEITAHIVAGDAIVKSRLRIMPERLAGIVSSESDPAVVERLIDKELDGVLDQLNKHWRDRG